MSRWSSKYRWPRQGRRTAPSRLGSLLLAGTMAWGLAACGGEDATADQAGAGTATPDPGGSETGTDAAGGVPEAVLSHDFEWGTFELADRVVSRLEAGEPIRIIVNNQGTGIPVFGFQQRQGMEQACDENADRLPLECRYTGPATTDYPAQRAELETLLTSDQVDCLVTQTGEPGAFVDVIDQYVEAGVPVFTNNGDVEESKRFAFYALDETAAARLNAEATAAVLADQELEATTVAMGSGAPTAPWAQMRLTGFSEGIQAEYPDVEMFNDVQDALGTGDDFTTESVVSSVGPFLSGNPDVDLFFHTDQGVEGVGKVIRDQDLTGEVWASGFNVSEPILDYLEGGEILVTIDQGFDNQSAAAVQACVDYLTTGDVPADPIQQLDPIVITRDGINGTMTAAEALQRLQPAE